MPKVLTRDEMREMLGPNLWPAVDKWLIRGDGIAVYENVDLGSSDLGHRKFVSFGSPAAQIECGDVTLVPDRLPDIGSQINWRYQFIGSYRGETLAGPAEDPHARCAGSTRCAECRAADGDL